MEIGCNNCTSYAPHPLASNPEVPEIRICCNGGGAVSGGGSVQLLEYTGADATSDGLVPDDQDSPAIAYSDDGTGPLQTWNTVTHAWV